VRCLDNEVYGVFTVTKPVTIDCLTSVIIGKITVNISEATFPNGVVTLRNMKVEGFLQQGSDGISVTGGGAAVHIENCTILGFSQQGIDFAPTSNVDLFVRDTIISNNANGGVFVHPAAAVAVRGSLSNVSLDQNGGFGLAVVKASGARSQITVEDTRVERDTVGLRANGASAFLLVSGATVAHNTTGVQALNGGKIVSSGNNTILFNTTDGAPTSTVHLK
jgi:hypothetical protein